MTEREKALWFFAGYFAAIAVEVIAGNLVRLLNDLLSEDESVGVAASPNGAAATARDQEVASESVALIGEYIGEEKQSE